MMHQAGLGPPPPVDGLLGIRHQHRRPFHLPPGQELGHQGLHDLPLGKGGVLELVQKEMLDAGIQPEVQGVGSTQHSGLPQEVGDVPEPVPPLPFLGFLEGRPYQPARRSRAPACRTMSRARSARARADRLVQERRLYDPGDWLRYVTSAAGISSPVSTNFFPIPTRKNSFQSLVPYRARPGARPPPPTCSWGSPPSAPGAPPRPAHGPACWQRRRISFLVTTPSPSALGNRRAQASSTSGSTSLRIWRRSST